MPNNIRSIIITLDSELKDEFYNKFFKVQSFKQLIISLLIYYFDSFYKRLLHNNPNKLTKKKYIYLLIIYKLQIYIMKFLKKFIVLYIIYILTYILIIYQKIILYIL